MNNNYNLKKFCLKYWIMLFILVSIAILLIILFIVSLCNKKTYAFNYLIAFSSYSGATFLGLIAVYQQEKFQAFQNEKDVEHNNYIVEERRLSFIPYLTSTCAEIQMLNDGDEYIDLSDGSKQIYSTDIGQVSDVLIALNEMEEFLYINYEFKNIGRDSLIDLELNINKTKIRFSSLVKNESKKCILKIKVDNKKDFLLDMVFAFKSLDGKTYKQFEKIRIIDLRQDDEQDHIWSIETGRISSLY